jgi:hypothetical protein
MFLLPVLSDIPSQYYCFCCLWSKLSPKETEFVHIKTTLCGRLSCYEPNLITNEHLSLADDASFTGCIFLWVAPIGICKKLTNSVYVKVISEELKFAHLPRYGPRRWNNKSTYLWQLIPFWASLTQFTFRSHIVCLEFIAILPYYCLFRIFISILPSYPRFYRRN